MGGVFSGDTPFFCYHDNSMLRNNHAFNLKSVFQKNRRLIFSPSNLPGRVYLCYVILIGLNPMMPCMFATAPLSCHFITNVHVAFGKRLGNFQVFPRIFPAKNGRRFHYIHIRTQKSSPFTESSQLRRFKKIPLIHVNKQ